MVSKLPTSLILLFVSLILSVIMMRMTEIALICVGLNALLLFAARHVAKIESDGSVSILMILFSLLLTAAIGEPQFGLVITVGLNVVVLIAMRLFAKTEFEDASLGRG